MTDSVPALKPGARLASAVCATEVIVVRTGPAGVVLRCGGVTMHERGVAGASAPPDRELMTGSVLGKRYTHPDIPGLEVLVTVAGEGTLSADGTALVVKDATPLPASD